MHSRLALVASCSLSCLATSGCSSPRDVPPAVRELYREAARRESRNPVVVIHGILGARLLQRSTGRTVWGAFTSDGIDPGTPDGALALALPLDVPENARAYAPELADVQAAGPLGAIELGLFFTVVNVQVYADILRSLGVGGYVDPVLVDPGSPAYDEAHFTCHTFFYDWRRDCVENAIRLGHWLSATRLDIAARARNRVAELRGAGGEDAAREAAELEEWLASGFRFDVVAHSMGGLIARWFLQFGDVDLPADGSVPEVTWRGAEVIDRLILVGTPNLGSIESLQTLLEGFDPGLFLPFYHQALLGTMPSIYQLLPRNGQGLLLREGRGDPAQRAVDLDLFDVATWEQNGWGLLDPRSERQLGWLLPQVSAPEERRRIAREYLGWCLERARRFHAALDQDPPRPGPAEIRLFAADTIPTMARAVLREDGGRLRPRFSGSGTTEPGDGTVARYSAIADRRLGRPGAARGWLDSPVPWSSVTFLPDDHIGLTRNPLFTDNLLFFLLEQRPRSR